MKTPFSIALCVGLVFAAGCGKDEPHMPNAGKGFFGPQKMTRTRDMKNASEAGKAPMPGDAAAAPGAAAPGAGNP